MGHLANQHPTAGFEPDDVQRMMRQLWAEYVARNPQLFNLS